MVRSHQLTNLTYLLPTLTVTNIPVKKYKNQIHII